jgi:hypothetical protein
MSSGCGSGLNYNRATKGRADPGGSET